MGSDDGDESMDWRFIVLTAMLVILLCIVVGCVCIWRRYHDSNKWISSDTIMEEANQRMEQKVVTATSGELDVGLEMEEIEQEIEGDIQTSMALDEWFKETTS